jgi:hypothetical protein
MSSGMYHRVVLIGTGVSEERIPSIFRVKTINGGDKFLSHVSSYKNHTVTHPRKPHSLLFIVRDPHIMDDMQEQTIVALECIPYIRDSRVRISKLKYFILYEINDFSPRHLIAWN